MFSELKGIPVGKQFVGNEEVVAATETGLF